MTPAALPETAAAETAPRKRAPETRTPVYVLRSAEWADLSPLAAHVYLCLDSYANPERVAWVAQSRLTTMTGCWRTSLWAALQELVEAKWITRTVRLSRTGERLADAYELHPPGTAAACDEEVRAVVAGEKREITSPLFRVGDIFTYKNATHIRELRLARPLVASAEFAALRVRSGLAWRLLQLLWCYTGHGRHPHYAGRTELAESLHAHVRSVSTLGAILEEGGWARIVPRRRYGRRLFNSFTLLVDRALSPAAAQGKKTAEAPTEPPPGGDLAAIEGPPPAELVAQLEEKWGSDVLGLSDADVWSLLHHYELLPAPEAVAVAVAQPPAVARRLVKAFHSGMRGRVAAAYEPAAVELATARELLRDYEEEVVWRALEHACNELRRGRQYPLHFHGGLPFIREFLAKASKKPPDGAPNRPRGKPLG